MAESDDSSAPPPRHHRVVVVGGGNAGLSVAGRLRRGGITGVAVIEPRTVHLFKPLFSHLAGGRARARDVMRSQLAVTPKGVEWIRDAVTVVDPEAKSVALASGGSVSYDHLVLCPGIVKAWDALPGLAEAMTTEWGASSYELDLAQKASVLLRDLESGTVVFTQPAGPASCSAAVQKPMYLACDYWRSRGVLDDIRVIMVVPSATIFGISEIDRELDRKIAEYGIELRTSSELVGVDVDARAALVATGDGEPERIPCDVLMVEPPQSAPGWIAASALDGPDTGGFVDVDPYLLRHPRHPNVWALGDAAATTNSKSGGALRKQTKAVADNIVASVAGRRPRSRYDGYSVCPFTVSRSTVVFAEFDDEYRLQPTLPRWTRMWRESPVTWIADRHILPWVYWHMILKGRA